MIDPNTETLISLAEAARLLPRRRGGKKAHVSCLYRWTTSGCKGVLLEFLQCGGTRCTSKEALARFFERLTSAAHGDRPAIRSVAQRERAAAAAAKALEDMGV